MEFQVYFALTSLEPPIMVHTCVATELFSVGPLTLLFSAGEGENGGGGDSRGAMKRFASLLYIWF